MQTLSIVLVKDSSDSFTIQRISVQNYVIILNLNSRLDKTIKEIDEMLNRKFDVVNVAFHGMDHNPSFMGLFDRFKKNENVDDDSSDEIIFEQTPVPKPAIRPIQDPLIREFPPHLVKEVYSSGRPNRIIVRPLTNSSQEAEEIREPISSSSEFNKIKEDAMTVIKSMGENGAYPDFMSKKAKTIQACLNFIMTVLDKRHEIAYADKVRIEMLKYLK